MTATNKKRFIANLRAEILLLCGAPEETIEFVGAITGVGIDMDED